MNYEEAFRHYREGTATDEEKAFVLDELAKAKALSTLLDDEALAVKPAPIKQAEAEDVRSAKHHLVVKRALAALITIAVIIVALGAILGGALYAALCSPTVRRMLWKIQGFFAFFRRKSGDFQRKHRRRSK